MPTPRVALLVDASRLETREVLDRIRAVLADHVDVVTELDANGTTLPDDLEFDLAVAVGGDGTLINQVRRVAEREVPVAGVNVGRLGFLAAFDVESLAEHAAIVFGSSPPCSRHLLLEVTVRDGDGRVTRTDMAVNDCVVGAGAPFRMIELGLSIDGAEGPVLCGDGVIVATPVGSTAYNVSAGGPIVHPSLAAIVITPLAAHSLAFRPIVVRDESCLRIDFLRTNPGTSLVRDGEVVAALEPGDAVEIRKHHRVAHLVDNPTTPYWHTLREKMRWAAPPSYRDRGP
jgi:NAD+ kinase